MVISGSDDREADAIECYTSLLDDEVTVLGIKVYSYKMRVIAIANYLCHCPDRIDMPCDEVSIDASLGSDTTLDIEGISDLFATKIGPRKALLHCKECITLR